MKDKNNNYILCCKCHAEADGYVTIDNKNYNVCAEHIPKGHKLQKPPQELQAKPKPKTKPKPKKKSQAKPKPKPKPKPQQKQSNQPTADDYQMSKIQELKSIGLTAVLNGKDYVTLAGCLYLAHQQGLKTVQTEIIEIDREAKFCLMKCTVTGDRGVYSSYGDAYPANVKRNMVDAYIRMADTRCTVRALRYYLGVGTGFEELPDAHINID